MRRIFTLTLFKDYEMRKVSKMELKTYFISKLSQMLFLDIKKERIEALFNVTVNEAVYLPVRACRMIQKAEEQQVEQIPMVFFIEGMFYVIGADESFKYTPLYKKILRQNPDFMQFIKGTIFKEIQKGNYEEGNSESENSKDSNIEDAYLMLKGLLAIEETKDNYEKLFMLVDSLRVNNKMYETEELDMIQKAKKIDGFATPYIYEVMIKKEKGEVKEALKAMEQYFEYGGKATEELKGLEEVLRNGANYQEGKELIYEAPEKALKMLLPLLEVFEEEAPLYFYIGVAYRVLNNYEKAIYYLNEALRIDSALVEVVNELGINYASLGDYKTAVAYLRKAFEATKAVEICTNIVMCYLNLGEVEQAKLHLEIAKKLAPEDEIVNELEILIKSIK